ncbi:hypothetical protein [Pseudomonas aeruginosa]|uniref:hypothetical protein n=1 Tax=Pseudomonas aeruginosa TaxID=287 RepID=UPI00053DD4C1|nr:hypothetical protein [Pseudomonas aeruginosa]
MTRLYGWAAVAALGALLWAHGWLAGVASADESAQQAQREQLRQAFEQGQALGTVRDRVVTQYVDRVKVVEKVGQTIVKEIPVYVTAEADRACTVPAGFVRVHDAAAAGVPPPEPAGPADAAPAGIALSAVAGTVADNYTSCRAIREQLISLQEYLQEHDNLTKKAPAQ